MTATSLLSFLSGGDASAANIDVSITPGASTKTTDAYSPYPVYATVGDTVRWQNKDSTAHTVTSGTAPDDPNKGQAFDSSPNFNPIMAPGATYSHTFDQTGSFQYFCGLHPSMRGTVIVDAEPDTTTPTISITSLDDGDVVSSVVTVSISASDNIGIKKVELFVDDMLVGSDTTLPYRIAVDTGAWTSGVHTMRALATDMSDNDQDTKIDLVFDNIAPDVAITTLANGATVKGLLSVGVSAMDNIELSRVEMYLDGSLKASDTTAPYSFELGTTAFAEGAHSLEVRGYDLAENEGFAQISINVDNVADPVAIAVQTDKSVYTEGESVLVTGSVSPVLSGTLQVEVLNSASIVVHSSQTIVGVDGTYSYQFVADEMMDGSGQYMIKVSYQSNTKSTGFTFTSANPVDTIKPTINAPASMEVEADSAAGTPFTFPEITATDNIQVTEGPTCSPASGSTFPLGTTIVTCKASDAAENTVSASFTVTVKDSAGPQINAPPDISIESADARTFVDIGTPTVSDEVDSSPTITNDAPADGFPVGKYTVTWTATDDFGNSASDTQIVTIVSPTLPPWVWGSIGAGVAISVTISIVLTRKGKSNSGGGNAGRPSPPDDATPQAVSVARPPADGNVQGQTSPEKVAVVDGPLQPILPDTPEKPERKSWPSPATVFPPAKIAGAQSVQDSSFQLAPKGYEIKNVIGRGGFGAVYLATSSKIDKKVALKIPKVDAFETVGRKFSDDFIREAKLWNSLSGPSIVKVHEYGITPIPWIAMEFMEGGNLRDLLKKEKLSIDRAVDIVVAVLDAMIEAHAKGVVHLDLKPENILFTASGDPKVADWGLAKVLFEVSAKTSTGFKGTLSYASPEQIDPSKYGPLDVRTDIYQVGVVLYEMLTGTLPYEGGGFVEIMAKILTAEPVAPSTLNSTIRQDLESVLLKAMAKTREGRYTYAVDFKRELLKLKAKPLQEKS